jgi:hypothetical protein
MRDLFWELLNTSKSKKSHPINLNSRFLKTITNKKTSNDSNLQQPSFACPYKVTFSEPKSRAHRILNNLQFMSQQSKSFVLLIATKPRLESLVNIALPSVARQSILPSAVYIVADRRAFTTIERENLINQFPSLKLQFLSNVNSPGAAGTWNTGLLAIERHEDDCYVAMLDDDDFWDSDHLEVCSSIASKHDWPDIVISGLRILKDEIEVPRAIVERVCVDDFLVGNPGWQGSNTFVHIKAFQQVGYFTDGLQSSNDRDLAIRLLSLPGVRVEFSRKFTANWRLDAEPDCLSRRRGPEKIAGLRQFLQLHGAKMTLDQRTQFFARCYQLFGIVEQELTS